MPRLQLKFQKLLCFTKTRLKSKNWNLKHYMRIKIRESILIFLSFPKQKGKKKPLPHHRRRGSWGRSRSDASSVRRRLHGSAILPSQPPPPPQASHRRCHLLTGLSLSLSLSTIFYIYLVAEKMMESKTKT